MDARLYAQLITHGANHAGVTKFRGYAIRMSTGGQIEFRLAVTGGDLLWVDDFTTNVTGKLIFPGVILAPGGVFVKVVSGVLGDTSSVLLNGN